MDIAVNYRKHGFIEDALRVVPSFEVEFRALCLLALVRVFMKMKQKEIEEFNELKHKQQKANKQMLKTGRDKAGKQHEDDYGELHIGESAAGDVVTKKADSAGGESKEEEKWKAFEAQRDEALKRLDTVLNITKYMKDSKYSAEAYLLYGVLTRDAQKVISGLYMFRRLHIYVGVIEGIHLLMTWKPHPYLNRLDVCRKVAEAFDHTLNTIEALVQPQKTPHEAQAEHCRNFYVVRRQHALDGSKRYRPLVAEGTRIESISSKDKDEAWPEARLHQVIVEDLFKKAMHWPEGVEDFARKECSRSYQCVHYAVGRQCPHQHSSGQSRCVHSHVAYNSKAFLEIINAAVTMLLMGGRAIVARQKITSIKPSSNNAVCDVVVLKNQLEAVYRLCNVQEWAERLHETLFPPHCFPRIATHSRTQCVDLLKLVRLEPVTVAVQHAMDVLFDPKLLRREANTDLLLKMCLLNVVVDPQMRKFCAILKSIEKTFAEHMAMRAFKAGNLNAQASEEDNWSLRDLGFMANSTTQELQPRGRGLSQVRA
jgi:hypothetical protein